MTPDFFSFRDGIVRQWDLGDVDPHRSPAEQAAELKEDLVQVSYGERSLLDIGWYPSFEEDGEFIVSVICDEDWDSPVFSRSCQDWDNLKDLVREAVLAATNVGRGEQNKVNSQ